MKESDSTHSDDVEATGDDTDATRRRFIRTVAGAAALGLGGNKLAEAGLIKLKLPPPKPQAARQAHRARGRGHDGEPLVRSHAGLGARRARQTGGAGVRGPRRGATFDVSARARLHGLRPSRSRSLLRRRTRTIQQRRGGRLAARGRERHLCHRLLHARRSAFLRRRRPSLDHVRRLLRRDHGGNVSQQNLSIRRADRPPQQHHGALHPAHHLGQPRGPRRERALLLQRFALSVAVGFEIPVHYP